MRYLVILLTTAFEKTGIHESLCLGCIQHGYTIHVRKIKGHSPSQYTVLTYYTANNYIYITTNLPDYLRKSFLKHVLHFFVQASRGPKCSQGLFLQSNMSEISPWSILISTKKKGGCTANIQIPFKTAGRIYFQSKQPSFLKGCALIFLLLSVVRHLF